MTSKLHFSLLCLNVAILVAPARSKVDRDAGEQPIGAFLYARHGDFCNATIPCDHDANFECFHGRCRCSPSMVYNPENLECRVKAGERCIHLVEDTEIERKFHYAHRLTFTCTSNATCGDDGICRCSSPYYFQDHLGQCRERKGMGGDCHHVDECDAEAGLVCWRGRCGCDPRRSRRPLGYGPVDTCVGIPGRACLNGQCELNSECKNGACVCIVGFQYDPGQRRCKGMFDEPCVDDSYCGEHFRCTGFRCRCKRPDQVFDDVLQRCFSIVGDACFGDNECIPNAICQTDGTGRPLCHCGSGYVEFGPGFCRNGYGMPCLDKKTKRTYLIEKDSLLASSFSDFERSMDDETRFEAFSLIKVAADGCDSSRKLRCRRGHCLCKESIEIYSERWGKCVSLADTLCHLNEDNNCVDHAECRPLPGQGHTEIGRCNCIRGYVTGKDRLCIPSFGP